MFELHSLSKYAQPVLRLGLAAVVVWFGASQLYNTAAWTSIVPTWALDISRLNAYTIVHMNGWFEIFAGTLLAVGLFTRWIALLLAVHIFIIALDLGLNPVGVRDFGLATALFSIALASSDAYCLEFQKKTKIQ